MGSFTGQLRPDCICAADRLRLKREQTRMLHWHCISRDMREGQGFGC